MQVWEAGCINACAHENLSAYCFPVSLWCLLVSFFLPSHSSTALWVYLADAACVYECSLICLKDRFGKREEGVLWMKSAVPDCLRGAAMRGSSLEQGRDSCASLHLSQELPFFEAVLRLFLKSHVCLDCFSRHFKKYYAKLTDSVVLYCNYQTIKRSCASDYWFECMTALQLCNLFHVPI